MRRILLAATGAVLTAALSLASPLLASPGSVDAEPSAQLLALPDGDPGGPSGGGGDPTG